MNKDTIYEKIDFTESILKHNVDLVNFADTKAGLVLGSAGIILSLLTFFGKIDLNIYEIFGLIITAILLSTTIFFSVLTIFPRITKKNKSESAIFYKSIIQQTKAEYKKMIYAMTLENILDDLLNNIHSMADIQNKKFGYLRKALFFMVISGISLSITLIFYFIN